MKKIKFIKLFILIRNNKFLMCFLRLFFVPFFIAFNSDLCFKEFMIKFAFFFILNFFWDKYIVTASIKRGKEIRNKNRVKRRKKTNK